MDGYEYERKCAEMLKAKGFTDVTVTPGSGDQGIDVIAHKGTVKYGIQCKYYEGSVGNKAVQEAFAGASFYDCAVAMVITNSTLTKPAHMLAKKLKVEILENVDAIYLNEAITTHNKAEQDRIEYVKKQRESLQESLQKGADNTERNLREQLEEVFSQRRQALTQSIADTKGSLNAAIKDAKSELHKQLNNINSELQETQQAMNSIGVLRPLKKRELKQKEKYLQSQIVPLEKELNAPQSAKIIQLQDMLKSQLKQLENLDKELKQQEKDIDDAISLYRSRLESYVKYKFSDKESMFKLKSQLGDDYMLLENVKAELIEGIILNRNTITELNAWGSLSQYSSHFIVVALKRLRDEGRIKSKMVKGRSVFDLNYGENHCQDTTEIIDDLGWNINELPPVPTFENAKEYGFSNRWKNPYTGENIKKHIMTALKTKPNITTEEIQNFDDFLSVFSRSTIGGNLHYMIKHGMICFEERGYRRTYSLP